MVRRLAAIAVLTACPLPGAAQIRTDERVNVARVLVDVRVTDGRNKPVRGLEASDFRVDIDGRPARIESATWIGFDSAGGGAAVEPRAAAAPGVVPPGRITVFMFQKSLEPSRIGGFMQMMKEAGRFVDRFGPSDRAAVVVFDSRLRVWQDFTTDRRRLSRVLGRGLLVDNPDDTAAEDGSLIAALDQPSAKGAATMEEALIVLGKALGKIEGGKALVLFGYGFGRFESNIGSPTGLAILGRDYEEARAALIAARVTVFAMDITKAETHTLETGLIAAAEDTGGFYQKVDEYQSAGMNRLAGALEGYYLLAVETPSSRPGRHDIRVRASAPRSHVSARRYYID